jgi:hypothetical protein
MSFHVLAILLCLLVVYCRLFFYFLEESITFEPGSVCLLPRRKLASGCQPNQGRYCDHCLQVQSSQMPSSIYYPHVLWQWITQSITFHEKSSKIQQSINSPERSMILRIWKNGKCHQSQIYLLLAGR